MMPLMSESRNKEFELRPEDVPAFPPTDESGEVDICLIDTLLDMTPTERLQLHAEFSEFAEQQRQQRAKEYGFDPADIGRIEEAE